MNILRGAAFPVIRLHDPRPQICAEIFRRQRILSPKPPQETRSAREMAAPERKAYPIHHRMSSPPMIPPRAQKSLISPAPISRKGNIQPNRISGEDHACQISRNTRASSRRGLPEPCQQRADYPYIADPHGMKIHDSGYSGSCQCQQSACNDPALTPFFKIVKL